MSWIYWSLLSALFAAATAILAKLGVANINSNLATAIRTSVVFFLAWGIALAEVPVSAITGLSRRTLMFLVLSGLATGLSWVCYFRALQLGEASRVAPVDKLSVVFVIVFASIFLGERITFATVAGGVLIAAGAVIVPLRKRGASRQQDDPHPEQRLAATRLNVIFVCEIELPIVSHSKGDQTCRHSPYVGSIAHQEWHLVTRDQNPPARVEGKRARAHPSRIDFLNQRRLAGRLIDRKDSYGVFSAGKNLTALEIGRAGGPIGQIHKLAGGVHVDCPRDLHGPNVRWVRQSFIDEQRLGAGRAIAQFPVDLDLVLTLERKEDPGLSWMKIKMPRLKIETASRSNRGSIRQHPVVVIEDPQRSSIFRFAGRGAISACHENHGLV